MIKRRLAAGEVLVGTFAALGSAVAVEAVARAGLDFVIIDLEHGAGDESRLLELLLAAERGGAHALVRVESAVRERTTRALDLGAEGVVCPRVDDAAAAAAWVAALRYGAGPGARGVALGTRGAGYGLAGDTVAHAREHVVGVVQIESPAAVEACEAIAAVDGVDVLFVGPQDLSFNLGVPFALDSPTYLAAVERVRAAAGRHAKACGLLVGDGATAAARRAEGWRFVAVGSDATLLAAAVAAELARARRPAPATPGGSP